jgi:hypothetical protein
MRRRIIQAMSVVAMGVVALAIDTTDAVAAKCAGTTYCVSQCPPYPDLVCAGWGCAGGECAAADCQGLHYTLTCEVS